MGQLSLWALGPLAPWFLSKLSSFRLDLNMLAPWPCGPLVPLNVVLVSSRLFNVAVFLVSSRVFFMMEETVLSLKYGRE